MPPRRPTGARSCSSCPPGAAVTCSTSAPIAATSRFGWRSGAASVTGVELIERHAVVARERGVDVRIGDLDDGIPFPSESFDVVHANQVLEHVRRTDVFMREVRRVLRPEGIACVSTNNLSSWHNGVSLERLEAVGYYPLPPAIARLAARIDSLHAAFLVALFRPVARENVALYVPPEETAAEVRLRA